MATNNHKTNTSFPCTRCGHCCRHIRQAVENARRLDFPAEVSNFPYPWDTHGVCTMLDKNHRCKVYNDRPLLCNVRQMHQYFNLSWEEYVKLNKEACESL